MPIKSRCGGTGKVRYRPRNRCSIRPCSIRVPACRSYYRGKAAMRLAPARIGLSKMTHQRQVGRVMPYIDFTNLFRSKRASQSRGNFAFNIYRHAFSIVRRVHEVFRVMRKRSINA
jgi:hypothetical protein